MRVGTDDFHVLIAAEVQCLFHGALLRQLAFQLMVGLHCQVHAFIAWL